MADVQPFPADISFKRGSQWAGGFPPEFPATASPVAATNANVASARGRWPEPLPTRHSEHLEPILTLPRAPIPTDICSAGCSADKA